MRVLMKETRRGCEDGFGVKRFHEGQEYDIADSLARSFIISGAAIRLPETSIMEDMLNIGKLLERFHEV